MTTVVVQRHIAAPPPTVFAAWTDARGVPAWWGPHGVTCTQASIDLRVGGRFCLENRLPDGTLIWISGTYLEITNPHRLRHTWTTTTDAPTRADVPRIDGEHDEVVTIDFVAAGSGTELVITHVGATDDALAAGHDAGWRGTLDRFGAVLGRGARQNTP